MRQTREAWERRPDCGSANQGGMFLLGTASFIKAAQGRAASWVSMESGSFAGAVAGLAIFPQDLQYILGESYLKWIRRGRAKDTQRQCG